MQQQFKNDLLRVPVKLYRIGEVVSCTTFSRQTIHNYTMMGLIREARWTTGGHRLYDESVFERLSKIIQLRKTKSLSEIRRILNKEEAAGKAGAAGQTDSLTIEGVDGPARPFGDN